MKLRFGNISNSQRRRQTERIRFLEKTGRISPCQQEFESDSPDTRYQCAICGDFQVTPNRLHLLWQHLAKKHGTYWEYTKTGSMGSDTNTLPVTHANHGSTSVAQSVGATVSLECPDKSQESRSETLARVTEQMDKISLSRDDSIDYRQAQKEVVEYFQCLVIH